MLRWLKALHNGRAKDGSLSAPEGLAAIGGVVGRWVARSQSPAAGADSPGDCICTGAKDRHDLVSGRGDQRRLRRR